MRLQRPILRELEEMKSFVQPLLLCLTLPPAALSLPEAYGRCHYPDTKKTYLEGMCLPVSKCNKGAWTLSNFCPYDGDGIKCCVKVPCHPQKEYSACMVDTACKGAGGKILMGKLNLSPVLWSQTDSICRSMSGTRQSHLLLWLSLMWDDEETSSTTMARSRRLEWLAKSNQRLLSCLINIRKVQAYQQTVNSLSRLEHSPDSLKLD